MLRGRRDRYHRLGLLIPLTVACIATPIQFAVGDTAARAIAKHQPVKFAAMECVQQTSTHVTEYIYGRCTSERRQGRHRHPRASTRSWSAGAPTPRSPGSTPCRPTTGRRPTRCCTGRSTRWSGSAALLIALGLWLGFAWWRKRDIPQTPWFLRAVAVSGIAAVVALECGWIVTEVGRQPWIVYDDHAHRGRGHEGRAASG